MLIFDVKREEFDNQVVGYYDYLATLAIPQKPTVEEMTLFQANLDSIRTNAIQVHSKYQANLVYFDFLYKNLKEAKFNEVRGELTKVTGKPPTEASTKSAVAKHLSESVYDRESKLTIIQILSELQYRESCFKSIMDVIKAKQESVHTPNNQLKIEAKIG